MSEERELCNVDYAQVEKGFGPEVPRRHTLAQAVDNALKVFDFRLVNGKVHVVEDAFLDKTVQLSRVSDLFAYAKLNDRMGSWTTSGVKKNEFWAALKLRLSQRRAG